MMGYSHTVSAAAGWLVLSELGVIQIPNTPTLIVTTLACAGAGVLPDIDHHNGSIARSIPPVSGWIARIVGLISGGHRNFRDHRVLGYRILWQYTHLPKYSVVVPCSRRILRRSGFADFRSSRRLDWGLRPRLCCVYHSFFRASSLGHFSGRNLTCYR